MLQGRLKLCVALAAAFVGACLVAICILVVRVHLSVRADQRAAWALYLSKTKRSGSNFTNSFATNGVVPALSTDGLLRLLRANGYPDSEIVNNTNPAGSGFVVVHSRFGKWSEGSWWQVGPVLEEWMFIKVDQGGHPVLMKWSLTSPAWGFHTRRDIDLLNDQLLDSGGPAQSPYAQEW